MAARFKRVSVRSTRGGDIIIALELALLGLVSHQS
jgi:hypothetical protein